MDRRTFLLSGIAAAGAPRVLRAEPGAPRVPAQDSSPSSTWAARWIWLPGQLAAHRHARRMHHAMERCAMVGYPANFRQPVTETYFRTTATTPSPTALRWTGPLGRLRVTAGGRGGDITSRSRQIAAGQSSIEVHIDFADGLPCLLLEGGPFSTGSSWEASLDGEHWGPVEVGEDGYPHRRPDEERETVVPVLVQHVIDPVGAPRDLYVVTPGQDVVLDFSGTELGVLRFDLRGTGGLTIQVGESVAEVRDPAPEYFEQYAVPPITASAAGTSITLPERALRFVRLSASDRVEVSRVRFDARVWPAEERGRFESSDADLNAIWQTAVATLRSNMHDFYLDGIRRDGLVWHDGPLTLDAYERVFFDADLSRQTLVSETLPPHPSVRDIGIIDSQMYAVVGFERELLARGDPAFSGLFRDRIEDIISFYQSIQDERGFVDARRVEPYGFFPDWTATEDSGPEAHGIPAYGQMLLAGALGAASRLARAWGDEPLASRWAASSTTLSAAIRTAFWLDARGAFANGFDRTGRLDTRITPFAQAFAIAFDIAGPRDHASLFRVLDNRAARPAHFSLSQVVELTAYAKAGRATAAVSRLRDVWLPMIRLGYRRFFEDIHPTIDPIAQLAMYGRRYGNSLCHAWSGAAPIMALSRGVLGVEPTSPGYRMCTVAPQRSGLEWVRGAVPTPTGAIEVEWHGERGQVRLPPTVSAHLPDGRIVGGPGPHPIVVS